MTKNIIKNTIIDIALFVLLFIPKSKLQKLRRKLSIRKLARIDGPAAGVEYARDCGVDIGEDCRIYSADFGPEPFLIKLGNNVLVSGNVQFITHDGGVNIFRKEYPNIIGNYGKIKIGNNCFIGFGAIILPNVEIGDNSIICAGAVVADSFPADSIIMGNPAKIIFKTSIYKKLKMTSKNTLTNNECSFPIFDSLPYEIRRKYILEKIGDIPIRKPHKTKGKQ